MAETRSLIGDDPLAPREAPDAKQRRLAREADEVRHAQAGADAGRLVDSSKVKAWIDSFGADSELPVPYFKG